MCGLDIAEKAAMLEDQIRAMLRVKDFSLLKFMVTGTAAPNPASQGKHSFTHHKSPCSITHTTHITRHTDEATVEFRIFAQAANEEALGTERVSVPEQQTYMKDATS